MVKAATDTGSLLGTFSIVRLSSFELSFGGLGGCPASTRRACRACQLFRRAAIWCFYADESRFHSALPSDVIYKRSWRGDEGEAKVA